jgi:hypothetical protein
MSGGGSNPGRVVDLDISDCVGHVLKARGLTRSPRVTRRDFQVSLVAESQGETICFEEGFTRIKAMQRQTS